MNDRILSLLGLCRRAGKLTMGNDTVIESVLNRKAKLVIAASDLSKRTAKGIFAASHENNVKVLEINRTKEQMGSALGKYCAVVAVLDSGFAKKLTELITAETRQEESANDKI